MSKSDLSSGFFVRHRRLLCWLLATVFIALGVHLAAWWVVTGQIRAGLPAFIDSAAQAGWQVETGSASRAGWPWAATVRLSDVVATRPLGGATLRWSAAWLDVTLASAEPRTLRIEPGGPQTLQAGNAPALDLQARIATLRAPLQGDGPLAVFVRDLDAKDAAGHGVTIGRIEARFDSVALAGVASPILLSPPLAAPFDGGAELSGRVLLSRPFPVAVSPARSAAAWQQSGGRVDVPEFALHWGALEASGQAAGGLDAQLQPVLRATLRVQGAAEMLDAASRAGAVAAGPASAAKAVLGLLTLAAKGGPLTLPVSLQDRTLMVTTFPILRLPLLDWGSP